MGFNENEKREVWVIDDDSITQFIAKKLLINYDSTLTTKHFTDPIEAYRSLSDKYLPLLILLDVNMPFLNGWQFLDQMQENGYNVDVHMFTSSIDERDKIRSNNYKQVKGYILKPLTQDKIENLFKTEHI